MAAAITVYDGHTTLFGVDVDADPLALTEKKVHKAVNRVFRGGKNMLRPQFGAINLIFENDADQQWFENGNMQGQAEYLKIRPGRFDGLCVAIAGKIFYIALVNENGYVHKVAEGNSAMVMMAFFCVAEEWVYIQDGSHNPIFWNGLLESTATRSTGTPGLQMPIGTIMAYGQGRVFVSNGYNQIAASDIMYGNGFTNTTNVQNFTEITYWAEGGYFNVPSTYGEIGGMGFMPAYGTNSRGQGELVVFARDGAISLDVSQDRSTWKDTAIQKVAMIGRGCIAPGSITTVNGDLWYRASDGWSSYTNNRIDLFQKVAFRKFSREVNPYLAGDTPNLIKFAQHVFHDDRIIGTTGASLAQSINPTIYGQHRFWKGLIALDLDPTSGALQEGTMNFDGLWTGIRPTGMSMVRERCMVMSYDTDGKNRLYEIKTFEGKDSYKYKVRSFYITKSLNGSPSGSSEFHIKRLAGGELWVSEIVGRISIEIAYRADNCPCWTDWVTFNYGSDDPYTRRRYKKWKLPTPEDHSAQGGSDLLSCNGAAFQIKISITGQAKVDRLRFLAKQEEESEIKLLVDEIDEEANVVYDDITCPMEDDYEYLIPTP